MRKRYWFLVFVALIGFGLSEVDRYTRKQPVAADELQQQEPDYYGEQLINRQFNNRGELTQTFTAARMNHMPARQLSEFEQPLITASSDTGQLWHISANRAEMPDNDNGMTFIGNVEVRPQDVDPRDDVLIETERLRYDSRQQMAETALPVEITSLNTHITATGMRLDLQNQQLHFEQQVNTRYAPQSSE